MCRKYVNYEIKVTYLNGDQETINNKEIDKTSYKQMLEVYRETKEHYEKENTCATIDFMGVSEDRELKVLFTKEIINEKEIEIVERAKEVKKSDVLDIVKNIRENLELLKEKSKASVGVFDKKRDILNHKIENCNSSNPESKLNLFNDLQIVLNERRKAKNDLKYIQMSKDKLRNKNIKIDSVFDVLDELIGRIEFLENKEYDFSDENIEDKIVKTYKYKNFKERINIMKQLQNCGKYDNITIDEIKMEIYAYKKFSKKAR